MAVYHDPPSNPDPRLMLREARTVLDFATMWRPLLQQSLKPARPRRDHEVMVVPGFGSGDAYTLPLRRYLKALGYQAHGWGLGTNLGGLNIRHQQHDISDRWRFEKLNTYNGEVGVPLVVDRLHDKVVQQHKASGRPISLIGWSLGGFIAREVARDLPGVVDRVITMGAPIIGGPKYTRAAEFYRQRGIDLDWIESRIRVRESNPIRQPITIIFSKSDAIVDWRATQDHVSPMVRHIEVDAAHLGMGFNREIWSLVSASLDAPLGQAV